MGEVFKTVRHIARRSLLATLAVVLVLSYRGAWAGSVTFDDCGSTSVDVVLTVPDCEGTECEFHRGKTYRIEIQFVPLFPTPTVEVVSLWYQGGVPEDIEQVPEEGCLTVQPRCPVQELRMTKYWADIVVAEDTPIIDSSLEWQLYTDLDLMLVCLRFPISILP